MPITVQMESDKLAVVRVSGLLKKSELDAMQADASKKLESVPDARFNVLMIIENFQGWQSGDDWGDMSFYSAHGDKMDKMTSSAIAITHTARPATDSAPARPLSPIDKDCSEKPASKPSAPI